MVAQLSQLTFALDRDESADDARAARTALSAWYRDVLVEHADEEESTTYRTAGRLVEGRLLVEAMVREHVLIKRLVALFEASTDAGRAAAYARAVLETFDSHQAKENDILLPLLVRMPGVSLVDVMAGAHGHHQVGAGHDHGDHDQT